MATLVAVVGTLATIILERFMTDAQEWIWRLAYTVVCVGALAILLLTNPIYPLLQNFEEHKVASTLTISLAGSILAATVWLFWIVKFPTLLQYTVAISRASVKRATVHDLFITDFPFLSSNGEAEVFPATPADAKAKLTIEFRVWYDLDSNTKFVGIWVPYSPDTFDVMGAVAEQYKNIINARIQSITAPANLPDKTRMNWAIKDGAFLGITLKKPGDSSIVNPLEFPYTGTVYLYYEYDLSLIQLGVLENLFRSKGLLPQFRNWDHVEGKPVPDVKSVIGRTVGFKRDDHVKSQMSLNE